MIAHITINGAPGLMDTVQLKRKEKARPEMLGRALPNPGESAHLWKAPLPDRRKTFMDARFTRRDH